MKKGFLFALLLFISTNLLSQIGFQNHDIVSDPKNSIGINSVATADLDGDGDLDVIFAQSATGSGLYWYANNGEGIFGSRNTITTTPVLEKDVETADMDGDGDIDVILASSNDNTVAWYKNLDGNGNFGNAIIITQVAVRVQSIKVSDIDGDGDGDILSASSNDGKIAWYENLDGLGNFGPQNVIATENFASGLYSSDMDGDGDMDVFFTKDANYGKVFWLKNLDGAGNFGPKQEIASYTNSGFEVVYTVDIDADGDQDVFYSYASKVAWRENTDGLGTLGPEQSVTDLALFMSDIIAVDIDNDGDLDIISSSKYDNKVAWYENLDGMGQFGPQNLITRYAMDVRSIVSGDLNNDGYVDIISGSYDDGKLAWYKNQDGAGTFSLPISIAKNAYFISGIYYEDLDNDGDLDLLTTSTGDNEIAWYPNLDGQGDFSYQHIISNSSLGSEFTSIVDLDQDGDKDIVTFDGEIVWFEHSDGLGNFNPKQTLLPQIQRMNSFNMVDIDGDNDMDILVSNEQSDIFWFENTDGLGSFGAQRPIVNPVTNVSLTYTADLDSDGDKDLLYCNNVGIFWSRNTDGLGNFEYVGPIATTNLDEPACITTGDIDNDGDLDVFCASKENDLVSWYENENGLGQFGPQNIINESDYTAYGNLVQVGDIDNDGDIDVVFDDSPGLVWAENIDGIGTFGSPQPIASHPFPYNDKIKIVDVNNDGNNDIISSNSNLFKWCENMGALGNILQGKLTLDANSNGCDGSDAGISSIMITTNNGVDSFATFTDPNGNYSMRVNEGDFSTTASNGLPNYYISLPGSQTTTFVGAGNTETIDFCAGFNTSINDLNISIVPITQARPGFDVRYRIIYQNIGTTLLNGEVMLEFDDSKITFLSASENVDSQTNNLLTFNYSNFDLFETRTIDLVFNVQTSTNVGDELFFTTTVNPISGDILPEDNVFYFKQKVVGSYDPNDITVLEGSEIYLDDIDKYLHYVIRFQNIGTAEAINIQVKNILDANLDWSTLQMENVSHANRIEIRNQNNIDFIFDNIYLPSSSVDEPSSHGFIAYKIKPKNSLEVGDVILNSASIYFDFNPAIVTNTVSTTVVENLGVEEFGLDGMVQLYPNPVSASFQIKTSKTISFEKATVYSTLGKLILETSENQINFETLSAGIYFVEVITDKGVVTKKIVKQ
ncbi:T9SS type A sorting domain-containing protein [Aequorivita todarodis]|uniref:T9SS type A sorting domain-containing protein n=1 Tax=Aequorivita todarodis TaxID=2036821 RepID=UPI002350690D|nr:T9SS type A sorting domain-containing protein [Aequorivita todarodis]MDC7999600.1 T9SS type A sorting domain-containing protein [Aequorivita todarodis]